MVHEGWRMYGKAGGEQFETMSLPFSTAECLQGCADKGFRYAAVTTRTRFVLQKGKSQLPFVDCVCGNRHPGGDKVNGNRCDKICTRSDFLAFLNKGLYDNLYKKKVIPAVKCGKNGGEACFDLSLGRKQLANHKGSFMVNYGGPYEAAFKREVNKDLDCMIPCAKGWNAGQSYRTHLLTNFDKKYWRAHDRPDLTSNPKAASAWAISLDVPLEKNTGCGSITMSGGYYGQAGLQDFILGRWVNVVYDLNKKTPNAPGLLPFSQEHEGIMTETACVGAPLYLRCAKPNDLLQIKEAFYGRHKNTAMCAEKGSPACEGRPENDVTSTVHKQCNGAKSCIVQVCDSSLSFRTCKAIKGRYLQVKYECKASGEKVVIKSSRSNSKVSMAGAELDIYGDNDRVASAGGVVRVSIPFIP